MLLTTWGQGLGEAPTSSSHYTWPLKLNDCTLHHPFFTDVHMSPSLTECVKDWDH